MTGFILGISFLIHIITLLSVIILWKKLQASNYEDITKTKREMEDLLLAYTAEMKEDNDKFLEELQSLSRTPTLHEVEIEDTHKSHPTGVDSDIIKSHKSTTEYQPLIDQTNEQYNPSLLSRVLTLKDQGYTVEQIAKKVDKGKGEVELLIKFYQDGQ